MTAKKFLFVSLIFFGLLTIVFFIQNKKEHDRKSANVSKKKVLKDRQLILGTAKFIQDKDKEFSVLKNHTEKQWALKNINFLKAMQILKEEKRPIPKIIVAVIDTGIHKKHPCLKNSLWTNTKEIPNNGKDDDKNGFTDDVHGWNFVDNDNNIQDYHGHGTHISGIIAAKGKTASSPNCRLIGVAPHVQIMTLKYFSPETNNNNIENTVKAINYAINNGADIINYSGGGPGENNAEKAAVAKAADKNIIFIAALGNDGSKISQINKKKTQPSDKKIVNKEREVASKKPFQKKQQFKYYPASYGFPNIISLQSQNRNNEIIASSNRVEVQYLDTKKRVQTGPGENILSTLPPQRYLQSHFMSKVLRTLASSQIKHNNYGLMTGTSQSTAMATGVTALVKTLYPSWNMEQVINQVNKTGYGGQKTEKIKDITNQGKKLDAYEALIMRDNTVNTFVDESIPDIHHPKEDNSLNLMKDINQFIKKKEKKK